MCPILSPKPKTSLAIILGASEWPKYPGFQSSPSFKNSAKDFRDYLLDENGFGLPSDNICDLFDTPLSFPDIIEEIRKFFQSRLNQPLEHDDLPQDLIVYYVGHGGFRESTNEYYLAIQSTREPDLYITSIPIQSLAKVIMENARYLRRYIIIDSCFSSAAYLSFMSAPIEVAYQKTVEALPNLPERGTTLLCSSGPRDPSKAPPGLYYTMFTGALIEVLKCVDENNITSFSFKDLHNLIIKKLMAKFESDLVRPEVHDPEQRHGDISEVKLFPAWRRQSQISAQFNIEINNSILIARIACLDRKSVV
jgi:hypothetical protein